MRARVVLVVGTGRSGTSTLARLLHEELEIPMAAAGTDRFPGRFWEDPLFKAITRPVFFNGASSGAWEADAETYIRHRLKMHGSRPWGLKLPQLAWTLWPFCRILQELTEPGSCVLTIEGRRPLWDVAASADRQAHMRPMWTALQEMALRDYALRRSVEDCRALRSLDHGHNVIDFSAKTPEESVLHFLREVIPSAWVRQ